MTKKEITLIIVLNIVFVQPYVNIANERVEERQCFSGGLLWHDTIPQW